MKGDSAVRKSVHEEPDASRRDVGKHGRSIEDRPVHAIGMAVEQGVDDRARPGDADDARPSRRDARLDELGDEVRDLAGRRRRQAVAAPEARQVRRQAVEGAEPLHVPAPLPAALAAPVEEDDGGGARGAGLLHVHPARSACPGVGPRGARSGLRPVHLAASPTSAGVSATP